MNGGLAHGGLGGVYSMPEERLYADPLGHDLPPLMNGAEQRLRSGWLLVDMAKDWKVVFTE